ncbi:MAG: putative entry exclusion protein TrbK-alt [Caulobacter sp.]|nr:putative entry exclusion protein TrbK-alt [Caulobacter sp.]
MDPALAFRLAAAGFVATAVVVAILDHRPAPATAEPLLTPSQPVAKSQDPRRQALRRCQTLGSAGAQNPDCLALWAAERDRFLGVPASEVR